MAHRGNHLAGYSLYRAWPHPSAPEERSVLRRAKCLLFVSLVGVKRTFLDMAAMSLNGPEADIGQHLSLQ